MRTRVIAAVIAAVCVASTGAVHAQEIALSGTVIDESAGVLPGVTVTARHDASGNTFVGTTDASGQYRIGALRAGVYTITVELTGFRTLTRQNLELLVGQRATIDFKLGLSSVEETVTVTGDAPLVDTAQSKLGGNIDSRQMEGLPILGRNWLQLSVLAKGSRLNRADDSPGAPNALNGQENPGNFQVNLDGQQVTSTLAQTVFGQPKFSRDAIAEFEFVTSRFDATQGRSSGVHVNAVTKSGGNVFSGTASGYFRDDNFNAKDFVVDRVLPYSNRQFSGTFGGPIKKDVAHFFGAYEGEREPRTVSYISAYPFFNAPDFTAARREHKITGRFDAQLSGQQRLMVRIAGWDHFDPLQSGGGSTAHSNRDRVLEEKSGQIWASWSMVRGRKLNELAAGVTYSEWLSRARTPMGGPAIQLRGYTFGLGSSGTIGGCCLLNQSVPSVSNKFTYVNGAHTLRVGGEFLRPRSRVVFDGNTIGTLDARGGAVPGNIGEILPSNDPSTWNLAALSRISTSYQIWTGEYDIWTTVPSFSSWIQHDWETPFGLTLNLGLRYDLFYNGLAQDFELLPLRRKVSQDWWNFGPRVGFAYALHEGQTVVRGGTGKYFAQVRDQANFHTKANHVMVPVLIPNDGRPNFAADPFNLLGGGHIPTVEEARVVPERATHSAFIADNAHEEYSYQSSIGFQRQVARDWSVEADYVWVAQRNVDNSRVASLTYNPETGVNYPWTDVTRRVWPNWSFVNMRFHDGRSDYHALETAIRKRFNNRWQFSATYTLGGEWVEDPAAPLLPGCEHPAIAPGPVCNVPVTLAPDLARDYYLSGAQRHRAVFNGIAELPHGVQVSGLYFVGDNGTRTTVPGVDVRLAQNFNGRLRPDGTLIPRNNFDLPALHRVDMRVQKRFRVAGAVSLDGIFEVFNLFNHVNHGAFITNEASSSFGRPQQIADVAYWPRMLQLGFRFVF